MKKLTTRLCSALLSVLMISSGTTALMVSATEVQDELPESNPVCATGDLSKQMEGKYDGVIIESPEDYYAINSNGATNKLIKDSTSLPESIDNSQSKYFPAIGSQGSLGSCTCWAQTYYQFTYTMNKSRGITTTPENTFSPIFTYSLVCSATPDLGSGYFDVATLMKETGATPVSSVPITDDCSNWYASEDIRREALKYRVKDFQMFDDIGSNEKQITSPDDEDLSAIKTSLATETSKVNVGKVNVWEPQSTTEPTTIPPTTAPPTTAPKKNIVTFTNSLNWSGNINCYYWSKSNTNMTSWPGKPMTYLTTNDYGQKMYTFEVPSDANYIIFTNGSSQTVDIPYSGGEVRYYAKTTKVNNDYEVGTW